MLLDFFTTNNRRSYDVRLAHTLGLLPAIYLSQLLDINDKAIRKDKVEQNYFTVDRSYIEYYTTLSKTDQLKIDDDLQNLGILQKKDNADTLSINIDKLFEFTEQQDLSSLPSVKKASKKAKSSKLTQRQKICENLKNFIVCENEELKAAYEGWIEGVYANPRGFLSKRSISIFQEEIDKYANHNLDLALKLIDIATVNGYRDATWAINKYNADTRSIAIPAKNFSWPISSDTSSTHPEAPPYKLSDEVF